MITSRRKLQVHLQYKHNAKETQCERQLFIIPHSTVNACETTFTPLIYRKQTINANFSIDEGAQMSFATIYVVDENGGWKDR